MTQKKGWNAGRTQSPIRAYEGILGRNEGGSGSESEKTDSLKSQG